MEVRTRFAPSPTGLLHVGHARAAMVARDFARSGGGKFLLRFEDIDTTRTRPEFYRNIEEDLKWLGLEWDEFPLRQTDRKNDYESAIGSLITRGIAYPCFCTRREILAELSRMSRAPHGPEGPLYPGTCRGLSGIEQARKISAGEDYAWRLDAHAAAQFCGELKFSDLRHGTICVAPALLGDVVLSRKDIGPAYHLAVVVDDAFQKISHVTRGEDLLPSTHVHRLLQSLLGLPEPAYLHHSLVRDENGNRLAKRDAALSIHSLRASGKSPDEVIALAQSACESSI